MLSGLLEPTVAELLSSPAHPPPAPPADPLVLEEARNIFGRARKPILAVGLGAVHAKVREEIQAVARKHKIPVVLTPMAKGLVAEDDPSYAGVLFHALSDMVGETHCQSDLVIGVGYDPVEFNYESWMPSPSRYGTHENSAEYGHCPGTRA